MDKLFNALASISPDSEESDEQQQQQQQAPDQDWPIPTPFPPGLPLLGNAAELDSEVTLHTFIRLSRTYGELYGFRIPKGNRYFISTVALLSEISDESRFEKQVAGALEELRDGVHSGLFTAHPGEKEWGIAHRILMPAFGPMSIRNMFPSMQDIASQLVLKWARHGAEHDIVVTDDFTRLTLDTLALCAMDYRFNSYYSETMHPFITAMVRFLTEGGNRSQRPKLATKYLTRKANAQWAEDIKFMRDLSHEIIRNRRAHRSDKKDLLNAMLEGVDPKTGEKMSEQSIVDNLITFLIAGHETTSGLLSFTFYNLIKHSAAYRKAQKEVDEVLGRDPITADHLPKLKYIAAVLRESLRLHPTAALWGVGLRPEVAERGPQYLANGKYEVEPGAPYLALLHQVHRDPAVYGEDAEEFKPERMVDEKFEKLPKHAWKPFGNGMRGCIGRPFAWQESLIVVATLLQHFDFEFSDPNYNLQIKQTLTIKPKDFQMRARLRHGMDAVEVERSLLSGTGLPKAAVASGAKSSDLHDTKDTGKQMSIFYGSNTGTSESLAQKLASNAALHGFSATVKTLDAATANVPKNQPVVFIAATFEGQPPDNATHFVEWLGGLSGDELKGVYYSVFGCGHRDWQATFQRIPKLVDEAVAKHGGTRLADRGLADAAGGDMFSEFDNWEDDKLWPAIAEKFGGADEVADSELKLEVECFTSARSSRLRHDVRAGEVTVARALTTPGEPEKRHLQIELPSDVTYRAGDYLAVLPLNPKQQIRRVMKKFRLPWDATMKITSNAPTSLPVDTVLSVHDVLAAYVELAKPATKKNIISLAKLANNDADRAELERLASDSVFAEAITEKRVSPLDLIEKFPTLDVTLGDFLALLPPMRVRQYSISSSPLRNPSACTLTYGVLDQEALSGQGRFVGAASNYLAQLEPGDHVQVSVRQSHQAFHLPLDPNVPILMICAGTGMAPFRGFVQERAQQIMAGRKLAKALLFVGCRHPERDALYKDEFEKWEKMGAVTVLYAYSRAPELSEGCKYVQHRLLKEKDTVRALWEDGAKIFVCGSNAVGEEVSRICKSLYLEAAEGKTEQDAEDWFRALRNERFATDVFV